MKQLMRLLGTLVASSALLAACGGDDNGSTDQDDDDGGNGGSGGMASGGMGGTGGTGGMATGGMGGAGGAPECTTPTDCDDADACTTDTCDAGVCNNAPVDPNDNNACTTDTCDSLTGVQNEPIDRDDMNVCTFDSCDPSVGPVNEGEVVLFSESFADNNAGWSLGPDWEIGPAMASTPGEAGSADPAQDHTGGADNGIAGIVIGGNVPTAVDNMVAYLESPPFDGTTGPMGSALELRLWRWLNADYDPYMLNTIEVYDGTQWVTLWSTQGNTEVIIDSDVPGFGDGWYPMSFDVTSYANAAFRVRFGFDVGDSDVYSIGGPNYDDVAVVSVPFATDADQCTVAAACDPVNGALFDPYVPMSDNIACTIDVCDSTYGVQHQPDDSTCDDTDLCTVDACDVSIGCTNTAVDPNDNDPCTLDSCDPSTGVSNVFQGFAETFADNSAGWTLDTNWAIGPAASGCGDPGSDHSPSADNGIAGVVIGGCAPTSPVDASVFYCATSPVVDTTPITNPTLSYWRDLYSDYTPYMKNKVDVFDGAQWVTVWESFGSPGINDATWTFHSYDLTAYSNANLQVRFCYNIGSAGAFSRGSWNLDDVTITPPGCTL